MVARLRRELVSLTENFTALFLWKLFSFETNAKSKINLVGKSSSLLTGTNKKKPRRQKIVERLSRVCQRGNCGGIRPTKSE